MPENIHVADEQPAMTTRPKEGEAVSSDQFALDFDVDIEIEGCYAIDVVLMESRLFGDDVVLENRSATVPRFCLGSGTHSFRVGTSTPAPAGATPMPTPPTGAETLPPIDGKWPAKHGLSSTAQLYYVIRLYRIGDCSASHTCDTIQRYDLEKCTPCCVQTGPNTGGDKPKLKPIPRELALLPAEDAGEAVALLSTGHRPGVPLTASSAPVWVDDEGVGFELEATRSEETLWSDGVIVRRYQVHLDSRRLTLTLPLRPTATLIELGRAMLESDHALRVAEQPIVVTGGLLIRHGKARWIDPEGAEKSTLFINDRRSNVIWPGEGPALSQLVFDTAHTVPPSVPGLVLSKETNVSIYIHDEFTGEHWYYAWFVNTVEVINPVHKYVNGIQEIIDRILHPISIHAPSECIKELKIYGHGGPIHARDGSGAVTGSAIKLGEGSDDWIRSTDWNDAGTLRDPNSLTAKLINELKRALCPGGRLIFTACYQGVGNLLENLSKDMDNGIIVSGYAGLNDNPITSPDLNFKDGQSYTPS
jgi:hypothetical protein